MIALVKELFSQRKQLSRLLAPVLYGAWFTILSLILFKSIGVGQLLPGYSSAEKEVLEITSQFPHIVDNFLYYPYYFLVYLSRFLIEDGIFAARLVSVLAIMGSSGCLLFLIRHKFGVLMSLIGVSIFTLNAWIVQIARTGTPEALALFFALGLLALIILTREHIQSSYLKALCLVGACLNWFMPLIPWFLAGVLTYLLYNQTNFKRLFSFRFRFSIITLAVVLSSLMVLSFQDNPSHILTIWGMPDQFSNIGQIFKNLFTTIQSIFWQAPINPENWLTNLPFLSIFTASFIPFGIYASRKKLSKASRHIFIFFLAILLLIASINNGIQTIGLEILLVLIMLIVIAGINEFLTHWKKVFPLNPLAKFIGVIVIIGLLNLSIFYQLRKYFVAWANHSQTQQIYYLESE